MKTVSSNLTDSKFNEFFKNLGGYLSIAPYGTEDIYNHKLDLIELHAFIYKKELTSSEIASILNIKVDTAEFTDDSDITEERDVVESDIKNFIDLLEYRKDLFASNYPFILSKHGSIKLKPRLLNKNKTYLILLCSSNLNRFKEFMSELTNDFEKITYKSINNLYGSIGNVTEFGNNTAYRKKNTRNKIIQLAKEMNIQIDYSKNSVTGKDKLTQHISKNSSKDRGSDIVAWIPFDDKIANMFMMFIQCASGHNWKNKLVENRKIRTFLNIQENIISYGFAVPFAFSLNGTFEDLDNHESGDNIIFDRSRLLQNIKTNDEFKTFQLLETILKTKIDYV